MAEHLSEIERRFPHVAESVVQRWGKPEALRYLDSLMMDSRGGRQGFPFEVLQELMLLRDVHVLNYGGPRKSPWEFTV